MMYDGKLISGIESQVERAEQSKRVALKFDNNQALRDYLRDLSMQLLEKASAPTDPSLSHAEYLGELNVKRGLIQAAEFLRLEACDLFQMSMEEYSS